MKSTIVVGVNGLERQSPLIWAVEESLRWDERLLIVHCIENRYETELPDPTVEQMRAAKAIIENATG